MLHLKQIDLMLLLFSFALHLLRLALSANYMNAIGIFFLALRKCGNVPLATSSKNKHGKKSVTSVCVCMCVIFAYCLCLVGCVHLNAPMCVCMFGNGTFCCYFTTRLKCNVLTSSVLVN